MKNIIYLTICVILLNINNMAIAKESLTIQGGSGKAIELSFEKVTGEDLETLNLSYEIKQRIKFQLEESKIFKFHDEIQKEKFSFLKKLLKFRSNQSKIFGNITIIIRAYDRKSLIAHIVLYDRYARKNVIDKEIKFKKYKWYEGANIISDLIYEHFTGLKGYMNTSLVFISEKGDPRYRHKRIAMMDFHGDNLKYLTNGNDLVLTPRISPDRRKIVYLSYASGFPTLYLLNIHNMRSKKLFDFDGMLYAPRFSNDGTKIILAASYNGNSEIIIYDFNDRKISRITHNHAIDTTPDFSPDGKKIVFSSDRTGSQQLYIADIDGKNLQKISFIEGSYATPSWSPDGKYIAFTKIYKGKFHIGVVNVLTLETKILTASYKDESPIWAPNSKFIIFTRKRPANKKFNDNLSGLYLINLNGEIIKKIRTPQDASDADWVVKR